MDGEAWWAAVHGVSSTRLEALVPSRDSKARTRFSSPRAWRPDFPGAALGVPEILVVPRARLLSHNPPEGLAEAPVTELALP